MIRYKKYIIHIHNMPSYLDMLPEDTITHIYRMLYNVM